jgi:hypothetical protein
MGPRYDPKDNLPLSTTIHSGTITAAKTAASKKNGRKPF